MIGQYNKQNENTCFLLELNGLYLTHFVMRNQGCRLYIYIFKVLTESCFAEKCNFDIKVSSKNTFHK